MTDLGLTAGPSAAGSLASRFGWPTDFPINLAVGRLALASRLRFLPRDAYDPYEGRCDLARPVDFRHRLVSVLLVLNRGHACGWTSTRVLASLGIAGMAAGVGLAGAVYNFVLARYPTSDPQALVPSIQSALPVGAGVTVLGLAKSLALRAGGAALHAERYP